MASRFRWSCIACVHGRGSRALEVKLSSSSPAAALLALYAGPGVCGSATLAAVTRSPAALLLMLLAACTVAAGCAEARPHADTLGRSSAGSASASAQPSSAKSSSSVAGLSTLPKVGANPHQLAAQIAAAEAALSRNDAPAAVLNRQGLIIQLASLKLAGHHGWAERVICAVPSAWRAAAAADIRATADLVALTPPDRRHLPPWRIIAEPGQAARGLPCGAGRYRGQLVVPGCD